MKLVGAVLVLCGSFAAAVSLIRGMERRVGTLWALTAALDILDHELEFSLTAMPELLESAAGRSPEPAAAFLRACAKQLRRQDGRSMAEIWSAEGERIFPELKGCDRRPLQSVGQVLGRYDAENQRVTIAAAREQLAGLWQEAAGERRRCGKVYATLCTAAGMIAVILLL